jgi:hypothetical protein
MLLEYLYSSFQYSVHTRISHSLIHWPIQRKIWSSQYVLEVRLLLLGGRWQISLLMEIPSGTYPIPQLHNLAILYPWVCWGYLLYKFWLANIWLIRKIVHIRFPRNDVGMIIKHHLAPSRLGSNMWICWRQALPCDVLLYLATTSTTIHWKSETNGVKLNCDIVRKQTYSSSKGRSLSNVIPLQLLA